MSSKSLCGQSNKDIALNSSLPPTRRSLPIALIRAREQAMQPIREMLAATGLTEQQWRVLRVLAEAGPIDATKLSDRAGLLLPSLTRIARSMSQKGLITRQSDPKDRRRQVLAITPVGQRIIADNHVHALRIVDGFKDRIGAEKYEQLLDLLEAFSAASDRDNTDS
ncbi:homoprotocatechuate degradation operon regulator HpaR [uncultured Tateyamaria sp.]|uniref:homoprotocatechuate degradation operon regulator HpaR n=1 Tax=uncultured Tateyamaria sp. TaxID=455651 RepID=UPI0026383761|nr:homoprotocatechuate degradation operon regulator HpaR [uncultured Tateyamaria sp.]